MGHISLKDQGYKTIIASEHKNEYSLNSLVDDIVYELVTKNPKLINDTEKGIIPHTALEQEIIRYIDVNKIVLNDESSRDEIISKVEDYLWGYGPLQPLIDDPDISDIKVVDKDNVRKKVMGKRMETDVRFPSERSLLTYCYYICIKNNALLSEADAIKQMTDTTTNPNFILRINVCIKPVNSKSPTVTIRKVPKDKYTLDDLVKMGMINSEIRDYLSKGVKAGLNILWCGKGASGKTTLMNACLDHIPHDKSILLMQESAELHTEHPDCVSQVVKFKSGESGVEYTLRSLTINGLVMDIDVMIIGEIKGAEAMDFFNAIYTGHIGWSSIHSVSAPAALNKAVHYMKYSGTDLRRDELLEMLSEVDMIIHMKDFKVNEIVEVQGFEYDKRDVTFKTIFNYDALEKKFNKLGDSCDKANKKLALHTCEGGAA